jgi:uncharacterized protein
MSEALLDVNVLLASVVQNHVHHLPAHQFVTNAVHFYTTPTTQGGFLRFLTRPWKNDQKQEQPPRMTMSEAISLLIKVERSAKHVFLADDESFSGISLRSMSGHRQWTDAYLIHLARKHALQFATFDGKIRAMDDPVAPVLLILA